MSIFETQAKVGRELFEINTNTFRRMVELQANGVKQYFEINQEFARRLPEVKDVSSFVEIQRDYGKALWTDARSNLTTGGEVLREAVEGTGKVLREAFTKNEPVKAAKGTAKAA